MKTFKSFFEQGLTVVEILVTVSVVAIFGVVVTEIFLRSIRGSNKAQILFTIKQNGQAILETMDKTVRNADNVVCVSMDLKKTLVTVKDGVYTRYKFENPTATENGQIRQDNPPPIGDLDEFLRRVCRDPLLPNYSIITDQNPQTGVSVQSDAKFTRGTYAGTKDTVTIEFKLAPAIRAPKAISSQIDPVEFKTTIQLR